MKNAAVAWATERRFLPHHCLRGGAGQTERMAVCQARKRLGPTEIGRFSNAVLFGTSATFQLQSKAARSCGRRGCEAVKWAHHSWYASSARKSRCSCVHLVSCDPAIEALPVAPRRAEAKHSREGRDKVAEEPAASKLALSARVCQASVACWAVLACGH